MRYCIFSVSDYKGGELHSSVNLSHRQFINELCEMFDDLDIDAKMIKRDTKIKKVLDETLVEDEISKEIKKEILKKLKSKDFYATYAGGDGFCGEIYEIDNNKLKQVSINSYVDEIVSVIRKDY